MSENATRLNPPVAKRSPVVRDHHGRTFVDDYEWLRDTDNPDTIAYLKAENAYTEQQLQPLHPLRDTLYAELRSRIKETDMSVPSRNASYWYFSRTYEGKSYGVNCRVPVAAEYADNPLDPAGWEPPEITEEALLGEEVLIDGNTEAEGHEFFALGAVAVSFGETLLAYSTDTVGDERYTLRFRSLDGNAAPGEEIPRIAPGVTFSRDDKYVFYVTVDEAWRPDTVWRHELGTDPAEDVQIFHEPDESYWVGCGMTRSEQYLQIVVGSKITSEVWMLDATNPTGEPWCVRPREHGVEYDVEHGRWGGTDHLLITHNCDAPNFAVARAAVGPVESFAALDTVVPSRSGVRVEGVDCFMTAAVLSYRENAIPRFALARIVDADGRPVTTAEAAAAGQLTEFEPVEFDEDLYTSGLGANGEWATPSLRIGYGSYISPGRVEDMVIATGERTLRREQEVLGGYDRTRYVQRRVFATAPDGVQVPISLVMSATTAAGVDAGTPAPALLYGYGSYEASMDPYFSVGRLSLLDRGVIFAVAHIRGGGEMGRTWYDDGKLLKKRNTFTDFVACADHLLDNGITTRDTLVAEGGSAGGLLMGAVANMAADRFAGIIASVPFVDPLTSILMPELPLTVIEWDEWGNPLHNAEVYDYMASYAPYENVTNQRYPAMYVITSLNDTRVLYVEPAKWVAKLRATAPSTNDPEHGVILQCEMEAGHGGVSGRYEAWKQASMENAWLLWTVGIRQ